MTAPIVDAVTLQRRGLQAHCGRIMDALPPPARPVVPGFFVAALSL
ncbi:hypothetical protein [Acidithiobacillus sp. IBUN Pt1247-S3]